MNPCGKMHFASQADAKTFVRWGQGGGRDLKLRPYRCPGCGGWHLTHYTKVEQRRLSKRSGRR